MECPVVKENMTKDKARNEISWPGNISKHHVFLPILEQHDENAI
jgi:hypothetical protein